MVTVDGARSPSPSSGLPPVPDAVTGEPAPPRAPQVVGPWAGHPKAGRRVKSWRPAARKIWGRGSGGALESVSARQQHIVRNSLLMAAISLALLSCFIYAVVSDESELTVDGFADTFPIAFFIWIPSVIAFYFATRDQGFYVGSTWITEHERLIDERSSTLRLNTYELGEVRVRRTARPDAILLMVSRKYESIKIPLGLLEGNPRLWDYVYNGLVHSVANGAEIDAATRELLHLAGPGGVGA